MIPGPVGRGQKALLREGRHLAKHWNLEKSESDDHVQATSPSRAEGVVLQGSYAMFVINISTVIDILKVASRYLMSFSSEGGA